MYSLCDIECMSANRCHGSQECRRCGKEFCTMDNGPEDGEFVCAKCLEKEKENEREITD